MHSDFLRSLDEMYLNPLPDVPQQPPPLQSSALADNLTSHNSHLLQPAQPSTANAGSDVSRAVSLSAAGLFGSHPGSPILGGVKSGTQTPPTGTEKFMLTAADQKDGTRDERLNRVIRAKYEAGLLKPFNFIKGYERLNKWMDSKWSPASKHRTLKTISEFRPAFRVGCMFIG